MKRKIFYLSTLIFLLIFAVITANIVLAEPGGDDDPIVSLSYINETVIPELKAYVDSKVSSAGGGTGGTSSAPTFQVVEVSQGQTLTAEAGTELILRMGSATIIATEKGGIADTTDGVDLPNYSQMPSNHLLIVPVADGRGLVAQTDILVMVKGGYKIS